MPFLVAEVMDKAPESFAPAILILGSTVPSCLVFGWLAPRPAVAFAFAVTVAFAAFLVATDRDDVIYDYARAEAGAHGVALYAQFHTLWVGPLVGLLAGLSLRLLRSREVALVSRDP